MVIRNEPLCADGSPMPTLYWLVGRLQVTAVSRLEAGGGVARAAREVDAAELARAHRRYAEERDGHLPAGHAGPLPSGGVGGTRVGVKCLHAHYAWHLAGGDDPVGRWVAEQLEPGHLEPGHREPGHREPGHREPGHREPGHMEPLEVAADD